MGNPIVHFEIRADDPDAARAFYGKLFEWEYPEGGLPGYTYVQSVEGAVPGGIGPRQGGPSLVTFFVGVDDVEQTLKRAEELGGSIVQPATQVPGVTFGLFADTEGHIVGVAAQG
jgi:predicted enzyme related to lactoylglutathione lyase